MGDTQEGVVSRGGWGGHINHDRSPYDHRTSHPYNATTDKVEFSPTSQTSRAPSAKRREMFRELHEG